MVAMEPWWWKGGWSHPLYKGRGSTSEAASYRGIMVSDDAAKAFHRLHRQRCQPLLDARSRESQHGGFKGRAGDAAAHKVRLWLSSHQRANESAAVLFVDVVGAFYAVIRDLLAVHAEAGAPAAL
eukprot:9259161-Lingulodinium_polyedra.AAC.1